jgi:Flp pilus assembly protein TadG
MSATAKRLIRPALRPDPLLPDKQSERGASVVEFAIVLSLLFLLVFGIIQFGIAFNRDNGLKAAAKEGARAASVGASQTEIATRIHQTQSMFADEDIDISIDWSNNNGSSYTAICDDATPDKCTLDTSPCGDAGIGNLVRVTATVPGSTGDGRYAIVIPFWGNAQITFIGDGVFRCENKT